jgi:heavy metal efflux system protein
VKVVPFLDRSDLVHFTTHTVLHNLTEGIILVASFCFVSGQMRGALIVALTIPFSLLFASICLDLNHIPANLLSLGALDFGMVVDGAVVMVENIVRHLRPRESGCSPIDRTGSARRRTKCSGRCSTIAIIITAYLPIFTLQRVEGRLFKPMAWTVAFALLGALFFHAARAGALELSVFGKNVEGVAQPGDGLDHAHYRAALRWAIRLAGLRGGRAGAWGFHLPGTSGVIGSEFLPHLDEGAIWARGTLAPSTGPTEGERVMNQARRDAFASFPEVTQVVSQVGRPDDGTDTTGFFNTEYFVDLKPKEQWRPVFHQDKEELIRAMDREVENSGRDLELLAADFRQHGRGGERREGRAGVKIYGDDLKVLEAKGDEIVASCERCRRGRPGPVPRARPAEPRISKSTAMQAAATASTWPMCRMPSKPPWAARRQPGAAGRAALRSGGALPGRLSRHQEAIENIRCCALGRARLARATLPGQVLDGASEIYREATRATWPSSTACAARPGQHGGGGHAQGGRAGETADGLYIDWAGEYESEKRSRSGLMIVLPITILVICMILHHVQILQVGAADSGQRRHGAHRRPAGAADHPHPFQRLFRHRFSGAVRRVRADGRHHARIHQPAARARAYHSDAAIEGAVERLRPIMMTMLVASFGLLPAALSHAIGSDSQRPFAIVIVGGLMAALILGIFLLPVLYVWVAANRTTYRSRIRRKSKTAGHAT